MGPFCFHYNTPNYRINVAWKSEKLQSMFSQIKITYKKNLRTNTTVYVKIRT